MHEGSVLSSVTLTVDVAVSPDHSADMDALVHAADEAMYTAKHEGGDRVQVAQRPEEKGPMTASR